MQFKSFVYPEVPNTKSTFINYYKKYNGTIKNNKKKTAKVTYLATVLANPEMSIISKFLTVWIWLVCLEKKNTIPHPFINKLDTIVLKPSIWAH